MEDLTRQVQEHYGRAGIERTLLDAVAAACKDKEPLTVEDTAPLDQMHMRGIAATRELARHAGIRNGDRVLDIGCGIGGPARTFAADTGCEVVGIDLVPEFVRVGQALTEQMGLSAHVGLREADALALPFEDGAFDVVTSMAAFMNIQDKAAAYQEIRRVLKPGGRLALIEVMQGPNGPPHFPILWAADPSYSFLVTPDALRDHLTAAGFREHTWADEDRQALEWAQNMERTMKADGPPPLGPHLLIGPDAPVRLGNANRSLAEGRITTALIVMEATETTDTTSATGRIVRE